MHVYHEAKSEWRRPSLRQRAGVLGLVVLVELAVLLLVLAFGGARVRDQIAAMAPISINFIPNPAPEPSPRERRRAAPVAQQPTPPVPVPPRPVTPPPVTPKAALPYIPLSKLELAAGDIATLGTAGGAPAAADSSSASSSAQVGEGPGGVALYNAEWVREPSNAELKTYLPREIPAGAWALIACRTMAHNQVENCAQLGESPRGSGLSKAIRLAAWQFKIRPPRIDGKPMVGSWVRIRIDFSEGEGEQ